MKTIFLCILMSLSLLGWAYFTPVTIDDEPITSRETTVAPNPTSTDKPLTRPFAEYSSVLEAPLFSSNRTRPVSDGIQIATQGIETTQGNLSEENFRIGGKLSTGSVTKVLVKYLDAPDQSGIWLSEGESSENIQIIDIDENSVDLSVNGRSLTIEIEPDLNAQEAAQ